MADDRPKEAFVVEEDRDTMVERVGGVVVGGHGRSPLAVAARALITLYQHTIGPMLGSSCRFDPSCSRYAYEAIGVYGFVRGAWAGIKRIGRCNPLREGGYDPIPHRKASR